MAEEFKVLISTELDTASVDSLKQQISGIKTNSIKIKIDTSNVTSQINKIKQQIQNLSGIKINLSGNGVGNGNSVKSIDDITRAYNDLQKIQKQLNSTRIKINGLDATKDVRQISVLSGQLQRLQADYNNLYQTFGKHFSTDQIDNLNRAFEITNNRIAATNANLADTSAIKQQEAAYKELLTISQQISKTEIKIGGIKGIIGHENEVAELEKQLNNLRTTYQQLATSMQGQLSTDQLRILSQMTYDTADKLNVLNAKIQDTKQKLATTSLNNFANDAGKIEKISEQFTNLKNKTTEADTAMKEFSKAVENMKAAKQSGDIDKIVRSYKEYENAVKRVSSEIKRAASVDSLNQARTALSSQMDVWLNNNSAAAKNFGSQIRTLQTELESCDATRLNGIKAEFTEITRQADLAGVATQSFGDRLKKQLSTLGTYFSASMIIMQSINALRSAYDNVMKIDSAFTELKKVTDETNASYEKFLTNSAQNAKEIGTTIDDYISSTADFARLGYNFDESQTLAKVANIYNVVGDEIENIDEATQSIISTMTAFDVEAENSISIVDKYNEVGNKFAISSGGIGEAMQRSAASMKAANNTIDETIALITAANTVVQDAPRVGNAFKTISMRIRGAKTELEEAGEDTEGMAKSVASLRQEIMALSGIDIMIDENTFKSTYQIMDELSQKWQDLTDIQQASITELLAGKHQGNVMSSLMNNFDVARQALDVSLNSEGSAMREHEKWMESLEARVNKLAASLQSLSQTFLKSDFLKGLIDGVTHFIDTIDKVIDKFGVLPTLIGVVTAALSFKGNGFIKLNTDADGFLNKLTIMNTSLRNIGTSIKATFSNLSTAFKQGGIKGLGSEIKNGAGNLFTNLVVSKSDIAAIKAYNAEIDRGATAQTAWYRTMQNSSNAAQSVVVSANGGKVAINGLGASMIAARVKTIALQAATTALNMAISMGLSIAISAIITAITNWVNKEKEAREAALEVGESARKEADEIIKLYNAYRQADAAYKNNTGSTEALTSAKEDLLKALGVEQSELENLIQKYGSLDDAIKGVTTESLKEKLSELTSGYKAAKEDLLDTTKDGWIDSFSMINFSHDEKKGTTKFAEVLKDAGLISAGSYGSAGGGIYIGDNTTIEGVIEIYDNLQKMKETLESKIGDMYTREELSESDIYNGINSKLSEFSEQYETLSGYIEDINKTAAQLQYNDYVGKNGVPETIEEYETLRDSLIKTAKSSDEFVGSQEQIENAVVDALADIPELSDTIEQYNSSLEETEEAVKGIQYVTEALNTLSEKSTEATTSISKLNEVLNAQTTGQSISVEDYNSDELKDYQSALEYVNGSMQLNADKAREIAKAKVEEQTAINNTNKELREAQYMENINQIEEYKRQLSEKNNLTDEEIQKIQQQISACEEQNNGYLAECDQLDVLNASLKESISTYNEWKAAQSASESGDMFDDTLTAIQKIDDTLNNTKYENYGKVGREDYKTSLDLIIPDSVNAENEKAVQKYLKSVSDMFTYDNDKNRAGLNIANFCDKAVEQGLMVFDKKKKEYQVAGGKMMEDFAKGLNLSMPMVQAMFGEMEEYGAKFDWGDEIFDTFGDGIVAAQKQITDLESEIDSLHKQKAAGVDIDDSKIKNAKKELKELKQQKEELTQKATVNIETHIDLEKKLKSAKADLTKVQAGIDIGINEKDAQAKVDKLQKKLDKLQEPTAVEIQASLGNIDSDLAEVQSKIDAIRGEILIHPELSQDENVKTALSNLESQKKSLQDKKVKIETYADTKKSVDDLTKLDKTKVDDKEFKINAITSDAEKAITRIKNGLDTLPTTKNVIITTTEKKQTIFNTGGNKVNGTAHVSGTAKASGDWRDKQGGETLVGELGREIVVNPHTGKWYTVGDNGAEFVNIPKNAIVFNHQQTEDLLSKGFVASRAVALANGTALASGTAMVTGGLRLVDAQRSTQRVFEKSKSTSKSKTKNSKSNSKNNEKSNEKKEKTALEKFQEWISKLFDWIEIKIQRQSEKIDKYISRAENAQEAGNYGTSARNYRKAINATTTQIVNERRASKKYNKQADKVVDKAVSMGVISQKQAASIKKQVQNGSMNIKKYGEKVREVIKDYQTWYEKSKDASKAVEELHNNIRKYIQDLKDMRDAQRQAKLDKLDTYTSIGTSGYAYTYQTQNSQLKFSNSELKKQDRAYNQEVKDVSKDVKSIGKSGIKSVNKALKSKDANGKSKKAKAYRKALNNAKKAIKAKKAVSSADMKVIKAHSISVYNKLYAYNQSLDNLETAKLEQATNFASTSAERFENIAQKYENKDTKTNAKIDLLRLKSSNATSVNDKNKNLDKVAQQYDQIVADDKAEIAEYKRQANSSAKTIKSKNGHGANYKNLGKTGKKNVTAIINKAKNAAKSGKTIDASVISKLAEYYSKGYISQSFYEACINYNNAIQHRKEAEAQLEIDEQTAIQEKAAIGSEKFSNVEQKYTNKQNENQSKKNKESINQSIKTTKGMTLTADDYQTMINYSKAEQKIYSDEITALNKTIQENLDSGYWTTTSQEYIDAMNSVRGYEEQVLSCEREQEELNNEIAQLPYTVFDKAVSMIQSLKANFQSLLNIRITRGIAKTSGDILSEIGYTNTEIAKQTERRQKLWQDYQTALYSEDGVYGGKDADTWLQVYYDTDTEINNLRADVESLNNEIAQLPYNVYERALSLLDGIAKYNKSIADLTKAQGRDLSENDYLTQMQDNTNMITQYEGERIQAYSDYLKALADVDGVYGGMTSDEWLARYYELGSTINGLKSDNEDIKTALRDDVYWRTFERTHKAAKALADVLSGISDLIDDDMLYNKDGQFTDFGVAQMANTIKQYETARDEVGNYTKDIQNLNSLYARGYYSQDEYNEKLNELQNSLFDSASAMKSYISTVIDMNKELAKSELDALFKLIDARNDALTAKKNYYDYDKTIKSKTKDIQALQAQIAALEGVETAEGKAQKARLEADLSDAKDDLNDTIVNHSFELSKDALSELKDILQDEFDDRWDNMWQNLDEVQKLLKAANDLSAAQSATVGNAINQLLSFYGINPVSTDINQYIGYASGTKRVDRDKMAWTQENGQEVIVRKSDGAILTPLNRGDAVIPNDLSNNLFAWGKENPQEFADSLIRGIPDVPNVQSSTPSIEQHYDSLINVEGNVDSTVVTDLEKFAKTFYQGSYKYTVNEIAKDARRKGIKP